MNFCILRNRFQKGVGDLLESSFFGAFPLLVVQICSFVTHLFSAPACIRTVTQTPDTTYSLIACVWALAPASQHMASRPSTESTELEAACAASRADHARVQPGGHCTLVQRHHALEAKVGSAGCTSSTATTPASISAVVRQRSKTPNWCVLAQLTFVMSDARVWC